MAHLISRQRAQTLRARAIEGARQRRSRVSERGNQGRLVNWENGTDPVLLLIGGKHHHTMRACRPRADVAIEVDVEGRVEFEAIAVHVDDMDLVVAFQTWDLICWPGSSSFLGPRPDV